jgi:hypothetical protein
MLTEQQFNDWIKALRSHQYTQTTKGVLRSPSECFCALGVLCDVLTKDPSTGYHWLFLSLSLNYSRYRIAKGFFESVSTVPFSLIPSDLKDEIIHLNDTEKKDFEYIANYIEERKEQFLSC